LARIRLWWLGTLHVVASPSRLVISVLAITLASGVAIVARLGSTTKQNSIDEQPVAPELRVDRRAQEPERTSVHLRSDVPDPVDASADAATGVAVVETPATENTGEPQAEFIADESRWPAEYESKSDAELEADAARLLSEYQAELDAEVERRFEVGQFVVYAQGDPAANGGTFGYRVGRGDELAIRVVDIDPRTSPEFFLKRTKSHWLTIELRRRRR